MSKPEGKDNAIFIDLYKCFLGSRQLFVEFPVHIAADLMQSVILSRPSEYRPFWPVLVLPS